MNLRSLIGLVALVVIGCEAETAPLSPGVVTGTCDGFYYDLDDGELVLVPRPCAVGTVCGTGATYQLCPAEGGRAWGDSGGIVTSETLAHTRPGIANYPFCDHPDDCGPGLCLFEPGCDAPIGLCCGSVCGANGVRPIAECERNTSCVLELCTCDGHTVEGLPVVPFAHVGACR